MGSALHDSLLSSFLLPLARSSHWNTQRKQQHHNNWTLITFLITLFILDFWSQGKVAGLLALLQKDKVLFVQNANRHKLVSRRLLDVLSYIQTALKPPASLNICQTDIIIVQKSSGHNPTDNRLLLQREIDFIHDTPLYYQLSVSITAAYRKQPYLHILLLRWIRVAGKYIKTFKQMALAYTGIFR